MSLDHLLAKMELGWKAYIFNFTLIGWFHSKSPKILNDSSYFIWILIPVFFKNAFHNFPKNRIFGACTPIMSFSWLLEVFIIYKCLLDHLLAKMELGWKAYIFSTSHVLKSNIELSTLNFTESLKSKIEFSFLNTQCLHQVKYFYILY